MASNFSGSSYTPALTNGANIASSTAGTGIYQRIGNTVSGYVDFTATGSSIADATINVSLPIPSNFSAVTDVFGGSGLARSGESFANTNSVSADTTADNFVLAIQATNAGARTYRINFHYIIK